MTAPAITEPTTPKPASAAKKAAPKKATARKPVKHPDSKRTRKAKRASKGKRQRKGPVITGDELKSRMLRVDAGFADWLSKEAKRRTNPKKGVYIRITDITRELHKRLSK